MSERRAKVVRAFLIEFGVSDNLIKITWHGKYKSQDDKLLAADPKQHQRVTVKLII